MWTCHRLMGRWEMKRWREREKITTKNELPFVDVCWVSSPSSRRTFEYRIRWSGRKKKWGLSSLWATWKSYALISAPFSWFLHTNESQKSSPTLSFLDHSWAANYFLWKIFYKACFPPHPHELSSKAASKNTFNCLKLNPLMILAPPSTLLSASRSSPAFFSEVAFWETDGFGVKEPGNWRIRFEVVEKVKMARGLWLKTKIRREITKSVYLYDVVEGSRRSLKSEGLGSLALQLTYLPSK